MIDNVILETDGYEGITVIAKQDHAVALHTAFLLENQYPVNAAIGGRGNIKRLKSFNEEVEFSTSVINPNDFSSNSYGQRLLTFLEGEYVGGYCV